MYIPIVGRRRLYKGCDPLRQRRLKTAIHIPIIEFHTYKSQKQYYFTNS